MAFSDILKQDVVLAPYTSIELGGRADWFAEVQDVDQLREGLRWAAREKVPALILGGGSNLILPDAGVRGLVLRLVFSGIRIDDASASPEGASSAAGADSVSVTAAAGTDWDELVQATVEAGLSGIECLSGIPGTVGATPIQNVGAYGQEVAQTIEVVECLDRATLQRRLFTNEECDFGYRHSRFKSSDRDRFIVLSVRYRLNRSRIAELRYGELRDRIAERFGAKGPPAGAPGLRAIRETVLELRRGKSMVLDPEDANTRSAGSFFLNPVLQPEAAEQLVQAAKRRGIETEPPRYPAPAGVKFPAAWLIEKAGFQKGFRRPGAAVSTNHSLALINPGGGTRRDLLELAAEIQRAVEQAFGVRLEIEPEIYGLRETGD